MERIKLGILRETKNPPDRRVPLTPRQCRALMGKYPLLELAVQPSAHRCFSDEEYRLEGVRLSEELSDCSILLGVKEVGSETLLDRKTYLFFSHTAKKQPYNRGLLQSVVRKGITLVDYEYLTAENGERVVAFGRWAGVVGAYNGIRAYGLRFGTFRLKPASLCHDLEDLMAGLDQVELGNTRFMLTGGGRVAGGAMEILQAAGIHQVEPGSYLRETYSHSVFTRLDPWHYTRLKGDGEFDFRHFVAHPGSYDNNLLPYASKTDIFIACHFWDPHSPKMLDRKTLSMGSIPIRIIADISCDIDGPIASTIRASTIAEPFYGYDPATGQETDPFMESAITVMAVDNLPGELPRDSSADFGEALMEHVIPELLGKKSTGMIRRASIASGGKLTESYDYLKDFLEGKE